MNVGIKGIELFCPDKVVGNEYYIEHFRKQGRDESGFFEAIGQKNRLIANHGEETTITLGIKATEKILQKMGLQGKDIDMIVFTSQFPERTVPSQAIYVHNAIGGKLDCLCFDMNANCVGMVMALNIVNKHMRAYPEINRALIIGADYSSKHCRDDSRIYSYMGDVGCAIIVEKTDEPDRWIDVVYTCDSRDYSVAGFPGCGMADIYSKDVQKNDKKLTVFHDENVSRNELAFRDFDSMLKRNNLKPNDIDGYFVSQAALPSVVELREKYGIPESKMPFVGCDYGYTGTSSPFVTLYESLKSGSVKEGDLVFIWSIGASYQSCGILMKL